MTGPLHGPLLPTVLPNEIRPPGPPLPMDGTNRPALTDQQVEDKAGEILETGKRFLKDDYGARAEHLAEVVADLSPEDAAKLVQELLRQDPGALHSWMNVDTIAQMHGEGRISDEGHAALANAFAEAYNDGRISDTDLSTFLGADVAMRHPPAVADAQYAALLDFLDAGGDTDAMNRMREDFAGYLLGESLHEMAPTFAFHAPGMAMQIADGSGDADMAARVFNDVLEKNGGSEEVRGQLLTALGDSSIGFENSAGAVDGLVNPMAVLIDSVAQQPGTTQWNDLAVAIARFANSADSAVFLDRDAPIAATSEALGNLLAGEHGDAILTALTHMDMTIVSGGNGEAFGQNAMDLGNLLRLTVLNPDSPNADAAMQTIEEWVSVRKDLLNGVERDDYPAGLDTSTAAEQLGMLGGAAVDGVQQMKISQDARAAANEALVGFVLDLALAAVPAGGKISALVSKDLKASFGNNPAIDRVIDQALSQGDTLNGQMVDQLKKDIAGVLTEEQVDLAVLRENASNFVIQSVLGGVSGEGSTHPLIIKNTIQNVQDDIAQHR